MMNKLVTGFRILLFSIWALFSILISFLFSLLFISKKPTIYFAKNMWAPIAILIMGGRLKIEGSENIKKNIAYVVMANHCSYLDIPALFVAFPIDLHFIAKKELKRMPFLGWFIILSGMIFIDRKNRSAAKESLDKAAKLVQKGHHVVIFPEGTASKTGKIGAFKKGGFHLANKAEAHIVPVGISGSYQVWPSSSKLTSKRGTIYVKIGTPIPPEEFETLEMDHRIERIRNTIQQLTDH